MENYKRLLSPTSLKASIVWLAILSVLLVAITYPRFNRQDLWIIDDYTTGGRVAREALYDAGAYIKQTQYFRGESQNPTQRPFVYRPLVPLLAAQLPFEPLTSINVINLFMMIVGLISLWFTLSLKTKLPLLKVIGCGLYVVSFGSFYYGTIGYLEGAVIGFLSLALYFVVSHQWIPLGLALISGPFLKESTLAMLPAFFGELRFHMQVGSLKIVVLSLLAGLVMLSGLYIARIVIVGSEAAQYIWSVSLEKFIFWELRDIIKLVLALGLPTLMLIVLLYPSRNSIKDIVTEGAPFLGGIVGTGAVIMYAITCCQADAGRFAWLLYPFLIPLVMLMLEKVYMQGAIKSST